MGSFLSVDKHVSNLEDILELNPKFLAQTKFYSNITPEITHHLKVWKLFEYDGKARVVNTVPIQLGAMSNPLPISDTECFVVLLVHGNMAAPPTDTIPYLLSRTLDTLNGAMTPRGLRTSVCSASRPSLTYHLYVLNGKRSPHHVRQYAFTKCFELEKLIESCYQLLAILFGGGVVRNKKLQRGSLLQMTRDMEGFKTFAHFLGNVNILDILFKGQRGISGLLNLPGRPLIRVTGNKSTTKPTMIETQQSAQIQMPFQLSAQLSGNGSHPQSQQLTQNSPQQSSSPAPTLSLNINRPKPPMLNLTLKPFEQTKYEQIYYEFTNGTINFDIRATARHELKMYYFETECTYILEGLFVSGEKVAKDFETLKKHEITHIVNCAADYCENWFEDQGITYMAFFLKDSQNYSIECLFYRVIEFVQNALRGKNKVLIHCIQGISRSVTMIIAYVMFVYEYDYKKAEAFVKQKRGVASPNNGFMVELIQFHKRLYEDIDSLPLPRVFLVSSHCKYTPYIITARLLKHQVYDNRKNIGLDCRGMYIVVIRDLIYLWIGSKCDETRMDRYWKYAQDYIKKLQKYEKAPKNLKVVTQGTEGLEFYNIWGIDYIPYLYENTEYNNLFVPIEDGMVQIKPGANRKLFNSDVEEYYKVKFKLFIFPDASRALGVFYMYDLTSLSVVFKDSRNSLHVYVWRERNCAVSEPEEKEFIEKLVNRHFRQADPRNIIVFNETEGKYSYYFITCFQ